MSKDKKELLGIADLIIEENEGMLLSGSLGLNMLGVKTRREPNDIDLYLPYGKKLHLIDGMKKSLIETEEDYENIYYKRDSYKIENVSIDIFTPIEPEGELKLSDEEDSSILARHLIIGFKVQHSLGEAWSALKHKNDIIHILVNN